MTVRAAGKPTRVLMQLFERRTLTYNPANPAASRVEMGNVGLQYYHWRYTALLPGDAATGLDPSMRAAIGAIADAGPKLRLSPRRGRGALPTPLPGPLSEDGAYGFAESRLSPASRSTAPTRRSRATPGIILVHEMQHARDFNALGDCRATRGSATPSRRAAS